MVGRNTRIALAAALALQCAGAYAINYDFMHQSPATYFTEEDHAIANAKALEILESGTDGETYEWRNEATGNHGTYTIRKTVEKDGQRCRSVTVYDAGGPAEMTTTHSACRGPDGEWKILR